MGKIEKAMELLKQGYEPAQIREMIPCSRSTVSKAKTRLEKQATRPIPPEISTIEEPVEIPALPPAEVKEEKEEEVPEWIEGLAEEEIPIEPPTKEEWRIIVESICGVDTLGPPPPEGYGYTAKKIKILANLWYIVIKVRWKEFIVKYGPEVLAIFGTIIVSLPQLRRLFEEVRNFMKVERRRERRRGEEEEEEGGPEPYKRGF